MIQPSRQYKLTDLLDASFMARLDALDVFSRKILQGKLQGERRSKRRGSSVEFADHRPYVVGDDLRHIDWNVFGRLEQLFLKLFMEEQDLTVHVAIDMSSSMDYGEPAKALAARRLAAALGYVGLVNNNRLTISSFADGMISQFANMRGRQNIHRMADFLLSSPLQGGTDFAKACKQIEHSRLGSGIMIVLSDFLFKQGYQQGLRRLVSPSYDLYAIQVLSPQELSPELTGDLKLLDMEDGDFAEVTVNAGLIKFYKKTLSAYCNELKDFCTQRGGTYMLANSADRVEPLVLNYLRKIGLLR